MLPYIDIVRRFPPRHRYEGIRALMAVAIVIDQQAEATDPSWRFVPLDQLLAGQGFTPEEIVAESNEAVTIAADVAPLQRDAAE